MDGLGMFDAEMAALLKQLDDGDVEVLVPTEATLSGYPCTFFDMTKTYGTWVAWPVQKSQPTLPHVPFIWFKAELDGELEFGKTGLGIFPNFFNPQGPDGPAVTRWRDAAELEARHFGEFSVADLCQAHPSLPGLIVPCFNAMKDAAREKVVETILDEQLRVFNDRVNGRVWLFGCSDAVVSSAVSTDGILALSACLREQVEKRQTITLFLAGDAYRLKEEATGWNVLAKKNVTGITRPMPSGVAWFRTSPATDWHRFDNRGFGIAIDGVGSGLLSFLSQFSGTGTKERVTVNGLADPLGSAFPLLAAISGFPKGKALPQFKRLMGPLWGLCRALSQQQKVTFWWLS